MSEKIEKPKIYSFLKVIGYLLGIVGIIILVISLMGDMFETSNMFGTFAGGSLLMISSFVLFVGYSPNIQKVMIKTSRYVVNDNKEDLTGIVDDSSDIIQGGVKKVARVLKEGLSEEDGKYCTNCGEKIDMDAKYCDSCGAKQ